MPHIGQVILGPRILFLLRGRIEDEINFRTLEASDFTVEADGDEMKLDLEDLLVPTRFLGKPIVGDDVGPPLILGQMFQEDGRDGTMSLALAASHRPCPAMMRLFRSIRMGLMKPNLIRDLAPLALAERIC